MEVFLSHQKMRIHLFAGTIFSEIPTRAIYLVRVHWCALNIDLYRPLKLLNRLTGNCTEIGYVYHKSSSKISVASLCDCTSSSYSSRSWSGINSVPSQSLLMVSQIILGICSLRNCCCILPPGPACYSSVCALSATVTTCLFSGTRTPSSSDSILFLLVETRFACHSSYNEPVLMRRSCSTFLTAWVHFDAAIDSVVPIGREPGENSTHTAPFRFTFDTVNSR